MAGIDTYTKLLWHGDGSDTSTTITDSSGSAHSATAVGNAQLDTAQFKFGTASLLFDGAGDYITLDGSSDFTFGTGDFTIDFWIRIASAAANYFFYDTRPAATQGVYPSLFMQSGVLSYYTDSAVRITGGSVSATTWTHVAVARSGTSTKMFVDGTQVGSTYSDSNNYLGGGGTRPWVGIASFDGSSFPYNGHIDEFRISKGIARWTANFTPPAAAYSDNTYTQFQRATRGFRRAF